MVAHFEDLPTRRGPGSKFRLLVDCTQTMKTPVTTGIQRVVKNLIKYGVLAARNRQIELVPVRFNGQVFERVFLTSKCELRSDQSERPTFAKRVRIRLKKIFINRHVDRQLKKLYQFFIRPQSSGGVIELGVRDILVLPDSSWSEDMWQEIDRAKRRGMIVGVLQHDFIPIRNPELVHQSSTAVFRRWMTESLMRADFVMAVSGTIAQECREELRKLGRPVIAAERVSVCLNGADFKTSGSSNKVRHELARFVDEAPGGPYLTIGTIEPRKNQKLLLEALDDVIRACPQERFLVAGIVGWQGAPIAERIRQHSCYGKNLLLIEDMTDSELAYAYRQAKAVVFPSLAEGFGLPIVESITRGTRVFASRIAVHQEIGSEYCVYFEPNDAGQLAGVLIDYSRDGRFPATWPPKGFRTPTWQEAAEAMVSTSLHHAHCLLGTKIATQYDLDSGNGSVSERKAS